MIISRGAGGAGGGEGPLVQGRAGGVRVAAREQDVHKGLQGEHDVPGVAGGAFQGEAFVRVLLRRVDVTPRSYMS